MANIFLHDEFNPEDTAMLQPLYSRSPESVEKHTEKVKKTGSGKFKGLTIPVKLTGPFNAMAWRIDFGAMVGDVAKAKVQEKKAAIEAEVKGKLEDRLKGLLGR